MKGKLCYERDDFRNGILFIIFVFGFYFLWLSIREKGNTFFSRSKEI